jgi:hypothetical protein
VSGRGNPHPVARWEVSRELLPRIDAHFWDWILWIGSKQLRGDRDLVRRELDKMQHALLQPMGLARRVDSVVETVGAYLTARSKQERRLGVRLDRRLEHEVSAALTRAVTKAE